MNSDSRLLRIAGVVVVLLLLAGTAYGLVAVDRPRVEAVDNDWGTVTQEWTEVETQLLVENPRLLRVGEAVANVEYTVSFNGIEMAHGQKKSIALSGERDVVNLSTRIDNDDIPEWWASHVEHNETTTVRVNPAVDVEYAGMRIPVESATRTRTVHTSLLEPLRTEENRRITASNRTLLIVNGTDARWGNATVERTPIHASATVTNPTPVPIPVTDIEYTIRMNGIVVGNGTAAGRTVVPPGETKTLETRAVIDNSKLDEWWVTHVRNDETTRMTVDFYATVELFGNRYRLPLESLSYERTFHTDILRPGGLPTNDSGTDRRAIATDRTARR
ncbi:LEA type 2 family protein [Halomarina pelagica]|uniref:LEA type 2 family protein n=1 Tax=Halomarina pelagica TaxID=2961599 RepID=UPI0020C4AE5F|nr:LEA type 2 family protein [Halomarina sp. BND7]